MIIEQQKRKVVWHSANRAVEEHPRAGESQSLVTPEYLASRFSRLTLRLHVTAVEWQIRPPGYVIMQGQLQLALVDKLEDWLASQRLDVQFYH